MVQKKGPGPEREAGWGWGVRVVYVYVSMPRDVRGALGPAKQRGWI